MKNNLEQYRKAASLSLGQLAERCRMAKSAIHGIENGTIPRLDNAYAISGVLNVELKDIFPDCTQFEDTNDLKQVKK